MTSFRFNAQKYSGHGMVMHQLQQLCKFKGTLSLGIFIAGYLKTAQIQFGWTQTVTEKALLPFMLPTKL
ncbi:MAG: hypothetical protein HQM14_17650 [SAR324 cluster bacterium]|nr:hypothetical protein [SAR324 cluster bacterium]